METRVCKVCQTEKPMSAFAFIKNRMGRGKEGYYRWQCKECELARNRANYKAKLDYHKERNRKYRHEVRHGLGEGGYDRMLAEQGGGCKICKATEPGGGRVYFAVDHDHNHCPGTYGCSECVRGLLCGSCNMALGGFKDSVEILEAAIEYLRLVRNT